MTHPGQRGFTLLEMLAAFAVFAVLSTLAYGGLNMLILQYQQGEVRATRLADLQRTLSLLGDDLLQMQPRGYREEFHGDAVHAFMAGPDKLHALEFTRGGRSNPTLTPRSTLQRVAWDIDGDRLTRTHWPLLDRAPQGPVVVTHLLGEVEQVGWRLLDREGEWHETWPPVDSPEGVLDVLPLAVEVTLVLRDWGEITRVLDSGRVTRAR